MAKKKSKTQKQLESIRQMQKQVASSRNGAGPAGSGRRSASGARSTWPWIVVGAVVVVIAVMVVVFATRGTKPGVNATAAGVATNSAGSGPVGSPASQNAGTGEGGGPATGLTGTSSSPPVPVSAIAEVTSVPESTLAQVGIPTGLAHIPTLPAGTPPVTSNGKPLVTYFGAEYCPYCAMERWPMVIALSRFGTFTGLGTTSSASNDIYPNTPSLSFYGSHYTSDYIDFDGVETASNVLGPDGKYLPLQPLTAEQRRLAETYDLQKYTHAADGGLPFVMLGNLYVWAGVSYDATPITGGLTFQKIADQLSDPSTRIAQVVDGAANQITALICRLTGGKPGSVCSAPYLQKAPQ